VSVRAHTLVTRPLVTVLSLLTVFAPISMDIYLPSLPALTRGLHTTASTAQLTVSACLLGLAGGQLLVGPLSGRFGRRRPLLIGVVGFIVGRSRRGRAPRHRDAAAAAAGRPRVAVLPRQWYRRHLTTGDVAGAG
jgi:MFS family permease